MCEAAGQILIGSGSTDASPSKVVGQGEQNQIETDALKTPAKCTENSRIGSILAPCEGMKFNSIFDAKKYYNTYARHMGFGISTYSSKYSEKVCIFAHFVCWRSGQARRKANAETHKDSPKIGCKASVKVKLEKDCGECVMYNVLLDHNHDLNPVAAAYLRSHRRITTPEKAEILNMRSVGISTTKVLSYMARRKGGIRKLSFTETDCRNFLTRERQCKLREGDAQRMLRHFTEMKRKDPTLFYAFDLNEHDQLSNIFWIDGRSSNSCRYFCDVVTFDTTYLTNRYEMPFAPFVGVNHHGQSVLLGCALLCNETTETFTWVFQTWLEANGGVSPRAIITDQDKAMEAAIGVVFPDARHRFCLWHILKKIPEKIGHICRKYDEFMVDFDKCIYDSTTTHEFMEKWDEILDKYVECKENEWLQNIYQCRRKWVPVYVNDHFFAGMSTSQRSESINHFFDEFVQSKTTLEEFILQYKTALEKRWDAEHEADVKTLETTAFLKTSSCFERQAAELYTRAIFQKFQKEVLEMTSCQPTILNVNENSLSLRVKSIDHVKVNGVERMFEKEFSVMCDKTGEVTCGCRCFEFRGYLCRHALIAFQLFGIISIPERYILKRWTKEMRYRHTLDECNMMGNSLIDESGRYSYLVYQTVKIAEIGASSSAAFNVAREIIPELLKKMLDAADANIVVQPSKEIRVSDPPRASRKGRPREKRIKSSAEKIKKKRRTEKKGMQPPMHQVEQAPLQEPSQPPIQAPLQQIEQSPLQEPIQPPLQEGEQPPFHPQSYVSLLYSQHGSFF